MEETIKKLQKLGLNERQAQAYNFILEHKQVKASSLARLFRVTLPGATKVLQALIKKGFIKKFQVGTKRFYSPVDLRQMKIEMIKKKKQEVEEKEKILNELETNYSGYSINVKRLGTDDLIYNYKEYVKDVKNFYEFIDFRNEVQNYPAMKYKNDVKFKTLYFGESGIEYGVDLKVDIEDKEKYAQILAFDQKVLFKVSDYENVILENKEIFNSVKMLIERIHKEKNNQ